MQNNLTEKLGYIGLGVMGGPMTLNLLGAGFEVNIWGRTPAKLSAAIEAGAHALASPKEIAEQSGPVFLCLSDTSAVEDVVFGEGGLAEGMNEGSLLIDHSSINPDQTRAFAARLRDTCGAAWIDAPVSGGPGGAQSGTLVIMAGGEASDIERLRTVTGATSQRVTHMGPVGCGQATKLVNQMIIGAEIAVIAEALGFAKTYGVDCALVPDALAGGWADSTVLQEHARRMIAAEYNEGAPGNMLKDMDTASDMGAATSSPMPVTDLVTGLYRKLSAQGDASKGQIGPMWLYAQAAL